MNILIVIYAMIPDLTRTVKRCVCLKALTMKYIDINSNMTAPHEKKQTFENFDFSLFSPVPDNSGKSSLDIAKNSI